MVTQVLHSQSHDISHHNHGWTSVSFRRHHVTIVDVGVSSEYLCYNAWKTECMYCSQLGPCRQPWVRSDSGETGCSSRDTRSQAPCTLLTSTGWGVVKWEAWFHNSSDDSAMNCGWAVNGTHVVEIWGLWEGSPIPTLSFLWSHRVSECSWDTEKANPETEHVHRKLPAL